MMTSASATGAGAGAFFLWLPERALEADNDDAPPFFDADAAPLAALLPVPAGAAGGAGVPAALLWFVLPPTAAAPSPVLLHASKSSRWFANVFWLTRIFLTFGV